MVYFTFIKMTNANIDEVLPEKEKKLLLESVSRSLPRMQRNEPVII